VDIKQSSADAENIKTLKRALHDRETEIDLLNETATAVSSELDLEKVYALVSKKSQELIQSETLLIALLNETCEEYTYRAGCGKNADEIVGESLPLNFGVCGWVWKNKRPWWRGVLDELGEEERNKWEKEAGSIILVPLFGKKHFLGGIVGIDKVGGEDFSKRDLDLLTLFANQVSFAIENATYYEQLNTAKQKTEEYFLELQLLNEELEKRVEERTSELAEANDRLQHIALHDSLTGLPNRTLVHDRLKYSISQAKRSKKPLSVMMIDLDRFKSINDSLGHHAGDILLQTIGNRIQGLLRDSDTTSRLGGDEFAIILPETDSESAKIVASRINEIVEAPIYLEGHNCSTAASIGIASCPEHGDDPMELLKHADVAMYAAKKSKSGYFIYDPNKDNNNQRKLLFMSELHEAIEKHKFELYYQPQISMITSQPIRLEALARWPHPEKGIVPPDEFIPALEQTGLIRKFTYWVLDTALEYCASLRSNNINSTMCVNLSMYNLSDPCLTDQVLSLLEKWKLDSNSLILEITETVIMENPEQVMETITFLTKKGIKFSIDDFGTGYSSLAYLKKLPVVEIKIDKSFVMDMMENEDDIMIVKSTIYMAHQLGLEVVAEGVENEESLNELRLLKCNYAQGYHICRPKPVDELAEYFNTLKH
jgi:diguanylate cyclase (GGDEF)-like protein